MLGKIVIFGSLLVAVSLAELPVSAPYAPSGWRPQGTPFVLPTQYFAPQRDTGVILEITKERVDYAGQLSNNNAAQVALNNIYLPPVDVDQPAGLDVIRVQGLPSRPLAQFKIVRPSQLNTQEYYPQRQSAPIRRPQKFTLNIRPQLFGKQTLQPIRVPSAQYGAAPVAQPATQYGVPAIGYPDSKIPEENATDNGFTFPSEENEEINDSYVTKGEYFVLTPEKTLQKVSYSTSQTEEEAKTNAFTAQLKYTPVDEINGPLYKYNEQGQLVRIYKK